MKAIQQKLMAITIVALGLQLGSCQQKGRIYEHIDPAHVEHIEGSELSHLTLTQKAADRTGIIMDVVSEEDSHLVVPYGTLIYDAHGHIWVYTSPKSLEYVRHEVKVDFVKGDKVYLLEGPPVGTQVVSQGATELYGTEYQVGH